jgi:hypothetical protein
MPFDWREENYYAVCLGNVLENLEIPSKRHNLLSGN